MFKVVVDRTHALVCMTASGFFSEAELSAAADQLHSGIRSLGPRIGRHVTLYDLSDLQIVSRPVLERFGTYFTDPAYASIWARRVALVTRSPAVSHQMSRVRSMRAELRVFDDRARAIPWLLAADVNDATPTKAPLLA